MQGRKKENSVIVEIMIQGFKRETVDMKSYKTVRKNVEKWETATTKIESQPES